MFKSLTMTVLLVFASTLAHATADGPAQQLVMDTTTRMLRVLKAEREVIREHPGRIYALVNDVILPHFDFSRMSRWVLGKHWRSASEGQQERFVAEFRTLLVRTYATALLEYSDQQVEYLPVKAAPREGEITVRTQIRQPGGFPIPINYQMYRDDAGTWKVFDVVIDGISLVANYRTAFSGQIGRDGLDRLIALLAERNQEAR